MTAVPRLIDSFIPEHYDLSLHIDRVPRSFRGTVAVRGSSVQHDTTITFHAKELTILSVVVDGKVATWSTDEDEALIVKHDDITPGVHVVVIEFSGAITDAMHGLYPCYFDVKGIQKELLATQFESHHAREVFPCIDEPEAKATFDLTLTTELGQIVLSNMPIERQREEPEGLVTKFTTSPRMSTYLLAWVIGELQKKTATTSSGIEVNVWATHAQPAESLDFAVDIVTRSIEFYDEYFGTAYPLPKSDHVALPDFSSGAMENWGLITYREVALLAHPDTTSISSKRYIATVIAHELAHQWFGNLVTMRWWNDLWLNESFATLVEYIAVDALHPEWNIWLDFASHESVAALRRDATDGVQSVQVDVSHPDEISTLFDGAIVYAKGARLLRMLEQYIGQAAFRHGLQTYFATYAYKNTEAQDLWNALSTSSGKNIAALMTPWIKEPGYPVVSASQSGDVVTLTQTQFFIGEHEPSTRTWPIPLGASWDNLPELFENTAVTATVNKSTPLRLNINGGAHFITHYDTVLRNTLLESIKHGELSEIERMQLLSEVLLLSRGGIVQAAELFPYLDANKHETSESVWSTLSMALVELRPFVEMAPESEKRLKVYTGAIARTQYERLGWKVRTGESEEDTKLRATILSLILYSEDTVAIETAKHIVEETPFDEIEPEIRPVILSAVIRHSESALVRDWFERYVSSQNPELSQDLCAALTSTRNDDAITYLLAALRDQKKIRPQDLFRWFAYLSSNRYARDQTWAWLVDSWEWIETTFAGDKSYDDFPRYAVNGVYTKEAASRFHNFFEPKKAEPALSRVIGLAFIDIDARITRIERDKNEVIAALEDR